MRSCAQSVASGEVGRELRPPLAGRKHNAFQILHRLAAPARAELHSEPAIARNPPSLPRPQPDLRRRPIRS